MPYPTPRQDIMPIVAAAAHVADCMRLLKCDKAAEHLHSSACTLRYLSERNDIEARKENPDPYKSAVAKKAGEVLASTKAAIDVLIMHYKQEE